MYIDIVIAMTVVDNALLADDICSCYCSSLPRKNLNIVVFFALGLDMAIALYKALALAMASSHL